MYKIFDTKSRKPQKRDWVLQIIDDINEVDLQLTFKEIKTMSTYSYKCKVKNVIRKAAFNWLIAEKDRPRSGNPRKGSQLKYEHLKMQEYFLPNTMTIKQCNLLFSLRSEMVSVRCNFRHSYSSLICQVCEDPEYLDSQEHILECKILLKDETSLVKNEISYNNLFSADVQKQAEITQCFEDLLTKKRKMEKKNCHRSDPSDPDNMIL